MKHPDVRVETLTEIAPHRARADRPVEIRVPQPMSVAVEPEFVDRGIGRPLILIGHREPAAQRRAARALVTSHLERTLPENAIVAVRMDWLSSAGIAGEDGKALAILHALRTSATDTLATSITSARDLASR